MSRDKAAHPVASDFPKLAKPAQRALQNAGLHKLEQLTSVIEAELLQMHGVGRHAFGQLRQALAERGLSFRAAKPNTGGPMDKATRAHLDNIRAGDGAVQNSAYTALMKITEAPVGWAYEAWDELLEGLKHKDNHVRAIWNLDPLRHHSRVEELV